MKPIFFSICLALIFGAIPTVAAAPLDPKLKKRLTTYRESISALEKGNGKLEPVFREGLGISKALLTSEGNGTVLEELSERDRTFVETRLKGFTINVEEVILAEPKPDFFIVLAKELKEAPSLAYFKLFKQWKPDGVWPAYIQVQVDYGGCTEYGKGLVTRLYSAVAKYKAQFPGHFVYEVKDIAKNLEYALSEGKCACGSKPSVEKELQSFLSEFPSEPISQKVEARLNLLRKGISDFEFGCTFQ